jgi:hypothetical protein
MINNKPESDTDDFPPMNPLGERNITGNSDFLHHCFIMVERLSDIGIFDKENYICTESDEWGLVFRIDYKHRSGSNPILTNRLICWKIKSGKFHVMLVEGQDVPALSSIRT